MLTVHKKVGKFKKKYLPYLQNAKKVGINAEKGRYQ